MQLYNTWFDPIQKKGRPIQELPIPVEIQEKGEVFIREFKDSKRLAYYADAQVWWCKHCRIVCANEEVLNDGSHEKCGTKEIERKNLKQWLMRIPHYAERLLEDLDSLDWPEGIKEMQRNWIGKSHGAEVDFKINSPTFEDYNIKVYTTRPDTLFGATYMVVAPEHDLIATLLQADTSTVSSETKTKVSNYVKMAALKSDMDRTELAKEKSGVFTGLYALNPLTQQEIPIWVADYVLTGYGTGAIMAVPAHDERDFEFAQKFNLPVVCIMDPGESCAPEHRDSILKGEACWTLDGNYIHSQNEIISLNGMSKKEGIHSIVQYLEKQKIGKATVNYKLRDWLFSRQRYWGEPFPVIHWEDGEISLLEVSKLPLELPQMAEFKPGEGGESPFANAGDWLIVTDKNGRKGRRETNTMPQWAGSCWYYLRFIDPHNEDVLADPERLKKWLPVDIYIGGAEHAVLHLLNARFWHKFLYDIGVVPTKEPFQKLYNQGMILGEDNAKMSKSIGNVVSPDEIIESHGADTLRLYEMFMGPLDADIAWSTTGVDGARRFLDRVWRLIID